MKHIALFSAFMFSIFALGLTAAQAGAGRPDHLTICAIARGKKCDVRDGMALGLFPTGLRPQFPRGAKCPEIDHGFAIDYAPYRTREVLHGGIDIPAPYGTPIIAAAAGEIVAIINDPLASYRGREIILRHSPRDTGLPFWTFTEYAHFMAPLRFRVGQRVKMGQVLGPTGNTGRGATPQQQSKRRRPAIHFAVFRAPGKGFVFFKKKVVVPIKGRWMDPVAFYRATPPYDSARLKALPRKAKTIPVAVLMKDGSLLPGRARRIWPYSCR